MPNFNSFKLKMDRSLLVNHLELRLKFFGFRLSVLLKHIRIIIGILLCMIVSIKGNVVGFFFFIWPLRLL